MRVIINADDLGVSQQINDATFDLISAGLISSKKYNNKTNILKPFRYKNLPLNFKLINYYQL